MKYYDSNGNLVEFNGLKTDFEGANGVIYLNGNGISYKEYFSYAETKISRSIFELLKNINNPHLIKLIERYYLSEFINDYDSFVEEIKNTDPIYGTYNRDITKIDLYTYYWVEREYIDILEQPKDYLLDNINALLKLSDLLSANFVVVSDIKVDNTVCNKNSIILIDPDMYYFIPPECTSSNPKLQYDKKIDLRLKNRIRIIYLISDLCHKLTEHKNDYISNRISELFKSSIEEPYKADHILSKKFKGYKMPIEYLSK